MAEDTALTTVGAEGIAVIETFANAVWNPDAVFMIASGFLHCYPLLILRK